MADNISDNDDPTPKTISKGTIIMVVATILFTIIAAILFTTFLRAPAGGTNSDSTNTGTLR